MSKVGQCPRKMILKRGVIGTYHHFSEADFGCHIAGFNFRYNTRKPNDTERAETALLGAIGKRLTYGRSIPLTA